MKKWRLKVIPGTTPDPTPDQFSSIDRPLFIGHYDIEMELFDFIPAANMKYFKPTKIKDERWKDIEAALGREIDDSHRDWIEWACASFIFPCVYKKELPPRDRYLADLDGRTTDIANAVHFLIEMLRFPTEIIDGELELTGKIFTDAEDHCKIIASTEWKDSLDALITLRDRVWDLNTEIVKCGRSNLRRPSHYELKYLLINLVYIAKSLGDNLNITSRDVRSQFGTETNKPTTLVLFVLDVMRILREDFSDMTNAYDISEADKTEAEKVVKSLLDKETANVLKPLEAARLFIEGKPRKKNRQKKLPD